jgi:anti-anti-sigma factor
MEIIVSEEQTRVPVKVLSLDGRLDATSQDQLRAAAEKEILGGARYLLLDFTKLTYMSSAGIRTLNRIIDMLRPRTKAKDGTPSGHIGDDSWALKIANPCSSVEGSLVMVGIDSFLEIHKDLKSALASF